MSNREGFTESLGSERLNPATRELSYEVLKTLFYWIKQPNSQNNNSNATTSKLELLHTIKDFPENSHIENYMLFDNIITDADIGVIINNILSIIKPNKKKEIESLFSKIDKRRFLSLLVLISINSKYGFILSNNMKSLYTTLDTHFFEDFPTGSKDKTSSSSSPISEKIKIVFIDFIKKYNSTITVELINSILSGKELYKIYKIGYSRKNNNPLFSGSSQPKQTHSVNLLSTELIKKRTNNWLLMIPSNSKDQPINSSPIAYIFDDYSKEEKNLLIKTNKFCKEISQLTDDIKEFYSSSFEISKSIFSNNELDTFTVAVKDTRDTIQKKELVRTTTTRNKRDRSKSLIRTRRK